MITIKVLCALLFLIGVLYALTSWCPPFYRLLLRYYRARSHRLTGEETYDNTFVFVLLRTLDLAVASSIWRKYAVTISSFTGLEDRKDQPEPWGVLLGAFLVLCQNNHCEQAIASDRERVAQAQTILGT